MSDIVNEKKTHDKFWVINKITEQAFKERFEVKNVDGLPSEEYFLQKHEHKS